MKHLFIIAFVLCSFSLFSQTVRDTVITGTNNGQPASWEVWEGGNIVETFELINSNNIPSYFKPYYGVGNIYHINADSLKVFMEIGNTIHSFPTVKDMVNWLNSRIKADKERERVRAHKARLRKA